MRLCHTAGAKEATIRLLQTEKDDYEKEIPTSELPKTFRDAMELCKRLSVRCLRIDSLCIVQDEASD